MNHQMGKPCAECPFRSDLKHGYLRAERITQIAESLFRGNSFPCHKTTVTVEDENGDSDRETTPESEQCPGAEIFLIKQGMSTQMGRIAERLGLAKLLDMDSPVCGSVEEMLEVHGVTPDETQGEFCDIAGEDCKAPAGLQVGSGIVPGTKFTDLTCYECGSYVCRSCSRMRKRRRICIPCLEVIEADE